MTELHKVMKKYLEANNCYPCNTLWEKQIREAIETDEAESEVSVDKRVMPNVKQLLNVSQIRLRKWNFEVLVDSKIPPDEIHFIDDSGQTIYKIVNVSA